MASDTAVRVVNLTKDFVLPQQRVSTLKSKTVSLFQRLSKEKRLALNDISFEIKKGEFFGIVGKNGSGKSTLLKCLAGVYTPNGGRIHVEGKLVPFIELGVGFNPELSGRDNVYLNGAILGFGRKQMETMYDEIVEFAELEEFMDQALKNYSSGMQVRLAFSIAIRAEGDILLLDEVLAVGDSAFQRKCLDYFRAVKKTGKTIILVSHAMPMVEEFCDRAMMIEDSKIVAIGDPIKVSAQYEMANSVYSDKRISNKSAKATAKNRPENPDIKITEVSVMSGDKPTTEFSLKDEVKVEVQLHAQKDTPAMLSLSLHNKDGEYVAGLNSRNNLPGLVVKKGNSTLCCRIAPGQFPNGPYRLTVNVISDPGDIKRRDGEIIDVASHEFGVELPDISFVERSLFKKGQFYMAADWELKQ